jgi:hypothetical protein
MDKKVSQSGVKGGRRQGNENEAPQYEEIEADFLPGIGSDLEPMNGEPVPPEGLSEEEI